MEMTVWELLSWMMMAVIKFLFVPSLMVARGAGPLETVLTATAGAVVGIQLFFHFGKLFMKYSAEWWSVLRPNARPRPVFTPGRRRMVRLRDRFGLLGLLALSGFISVPITAMIAAKFYNRIPGVTLWLTLGFAAWAVVLTLLSHWVRSGLAPA